MKKGILILILVLMAVCFAPVFVSANTYDTTALSVGYHPVLYTDLIDNMYSDRPFVNFYHGTVNIGWDSPAGYLTIARQVSTGAYQIKNQNTAAGIELSGKVNVVDNGYLTSTGNFVIKLS